MDQELIGRLVQRVDRLLAAYTALKDENLQLRSELRQLQENRQAVRVRIDDLLGKLEGVDGL